MQAHPSILVNGLLSPVKLWSRGELRTRGSVPPSAGAYAWYVCPESLPLAIETHHCFKKDGFILAYSGETGPTSFGLRRRLRAHHSRDAGHSNFRLSLGTVLRDALQIRLLPCDSAEFVKGGEDKLSSWIDAHARVAWVTTPDKETAEYVQDEIIRIHRPVLNLRERNHASATWLSDRVCEQRAALACRRSDLRWSHILSDLRLP